MRTILIVLVAAAVIAIGSYKTHNPQHQPLQPRTAAGADPIPVCPYPNCNPDHLRASR